MNGFRIRNAQPEDAQQICDTCVAAYQEYQRFVGQAGWETMHLGLQNVWANNPTAQWAVLEDEAGIQACVAYFSPHMTPHKYFPEDWAYLRFLAVHPRARGKGYARPLMEWCIQQAEKDGAEALGLHTSQQAGYGYRLYERMGWVKDQELPAFQGLEYVRYVRRAEG